MLTIDNTALVVVDVQAKLMAFIHENDQLVDSLRRIIMGAKAFGLPIIWAEQNPEGLAPTVDEVAELLPGEPIVKMTMSCCGEEAFVDALGSLGRKQILLTGIESHVCVYQTGRDLLAAGYEVYVVADAVSSRTPANRQIGLDALTRAGAHTTSVEMALFELMATAEHPAFKQILKIVK